MANPRRRPSRHFFTREPDNSVRIRLRFDPAEASLYEEAAGEVPLLDWIRQTLNEAAERQVANSRRERAQVEPPRL